MASFAAAPCGLAWDAELAALVAAGPEDALARATAATFDALKAELAAVLDAMTRAAHGAASLDDATVYPIMLTSSDALSRYWAPAANGDNDHEGVQLLAFVSEAWALVVGGKCSSC